MKSGHLVASKYRLVNRLGTGGMGAVWSAVHLQTGRELAIKFLHPLVASESDDVRQRFMQEARTSSRVTHPGIIDIFDAGETDDGTLFLVMELLEGLSLAEALRVEPPLDARELLTALGGAVNALGAAHAAGIIHRDVKPPNIFLYRDRATSRIKPKLLDFGVSKVLSGDDGISTFTGSLLGSPRYMAPEQAVSAARADARSDIWSFGVILFEAFTGEFPHDGDSSSSLVVAIATKPPKSIQQYAPGLPLSLRLLIDDCLQPQADRIQSAEELADRIREVLIREDLRDFMVVLPSRMKKPLVRPEDFVIDAGVFPIRDADIEHLPTIPEVSYAELGPPAPPVPTNDEATVVRPMSHPDLQRPQPTAEVKAGFGRTQPLPPPSVPNLRDPTVDPTESVSSINVVRGVTNVRHASSPVTNGGRPPPLTTRTLVAVAAAVVGLVAALSIAVVVVVRQGSGPPAETAAAALHTVQPPLPPPEPEADPSSSGVFVEPVASADVPSALASASATPTAAVSTSKPRLTGKLPKPKSADPLDAKGSGIQLPPRR